MTNNDMYYYCTTHEELLVNFWEGIDHVYKKSNGRKEIKCDLIRLGSSDIERKIIQNEIENNIFNIEEWK
ncbi:MAG: hypothetical protein ABEK17_03735 [Candidatus Aenigmatarchaeota archaeon]